MSPVEPHQLKLPWTPLTRRCRGPFQVIFGPKETQRKLLDYILKTLYELRVSVGFIYALGLKYPL